MQRFLFGFVFFFSALSLGFVTSAGRNEVVKPYFNTPLRVLLDKGQQELRMKSVLNSIYLKEPDQEKWIKIGGQAVIQITRNKNNILINGVTYKAHSIYFRGGPQHTDPINYGNRLYRGALKLHLTRAGLILTNIIPLEEYLYGQVAGEMNPNWEMEALKAQVVAARTYALYMIKHPKSPFYDLEKGTSDQVYLGAQSESVRIRKAVESTRNEFVTKELLPIKAYYHSRCGGYTESASSVWNKLEKHSRISVPCPYCQKFPYSWKTSVKAKELFNVVKLPFEKLKPFGISISDKSPSGRVKEVVLESNQRKLSVKSEELRHLLGYANVKSTRFEVKLNQKEEEIHFEGTGAGHGVGMCQWGAQFLAKQGKSYREILAHYYPSYKIAETQKTFFP